MVILSILAFVCVIKLAGGTQVFWELPNCNAIAEYNGHTLKIERACEQASSLYTFLLYQTVGFKTECQWTSFTRQSFSICESLTTLPQKKTRTVFEHIYNGTYCLAVYHGEWTSSLPICNSEVPFYLETKLTELDVIQWNPTLNIQQHGSNDLFIRLGINQSDGFNFNTFDIEVYNIEEDVTNCDLLAMLPPNYSIKVRISRDRIILSNLTEGFYCFKVTPVDPRCIHPFSVTYLPCTRSSNSTRIIFPIGRNDPTVIVFGAMSIFLIICAIAAIFLKKKKKKKNGRSEFDEPLMSSIFLLHSNEERHQGNIQMLKKTLRERLSLIEIDDYTDEHQWMNVAVEGISWFLSRLNQKGKCIIVIEPILEEALESDHQSQLVENNYFFIGMQQLQTLASSPDYKRVLTVWFQNSFESTNDQQKQFGNPFQNFKLPSELDLLIQQIENLGSE
ncbi:uncharacterized protein LOC124188321 [Daphnia pulex]|uniref:uncharacterized protein LOC124188321 n=1 Tax=Daphnia pulex TaxID=6669 RepID=UPI001EDE53FA|nr:uncharacterized protein LOC124188321 [Daphnia pulex]